MTNEPNWKKGDIIASLHDYTGNVVCISEAEHDPVYAEGWFGSKDWYYGLRPCKYIRLATQEDLDNRIKWQRKRTDIEQKHLDKLLDFRERLTNQ
jgi:hypothetical protein